MAEMKGRQYFRIRSKSSGLVMRPDPSQQLRPGVRVVMWPETDMRSHDSALFYEEPRTTTIRMKGNDYCFDVNRRGFLVLNPYKVDSMNQMWRIQDQAIQNGDHSDRVLDVSGYKGLLPGSDIEAYSDNIHKGGSQSWVFQAY